MVSWSGMPAFIVAEPCDIAGFAYIPAGPRRAPESSPKEPTLRIEDIEDHDGGPLPAWTPEEDG